MPFLGLLLISFAWVGQETPSEPASAVTFELQDFLGARHSSNDIPRNKLVVLAFLGVDCPIANRYAPKLAELAREFEPKGVVFVAVDANRQDGVTAMARFAKANGLPFPFLKDAGNKLADQLQVDRTPEVLVLDTKRVVRYRGRIDDQFGLGVHRASPTRRDLAVAVEELLGGRTVSVPRTGAIGCRIGRSRPTGRGPVTYSKQIARILRDRCIACHRTGEIAPFALTTYAQAAGWAETIAEVVRDGRMPPWHASPEFGEFSNDGRLTDEEKGMIAAWVADGAPEGDSADLPELSVFADGWLISKPDLVLELPKTVEIPASGSFPFQYFEVDPKLDHDVWVRASQVRPSNRTVVHHIAVFVVPPGERVDSPASQFDPLGGYLPGGMIPRELPEGTAHLIPAGSKLGFQIHYTPCGTPQTDRTAIGLYLTDPTTVKKRMTTLSVVNTQLRIPPGAADYKVTAEYRISQDHILYSLVPHMHLRGKSFRFEATYPDGRHEVLLDVPRYEFDWQNAYVLAEPKLVPEGTVVKCLGGFDNSADNPNNPDPSQEVTFGAETNDEMMAGYIGATLSYQDLRLGAPKVNPHGDGSFDVTFRHRPPEGTKTVHLAATFNKDFSPVQKLDGPDERGTFATTVRLATGRYEYKYVHDLKSYRHDPANWRQVGFFNNSVLTVGNPGPPVPVARVAAGRVQETGSRQWSGHLSFSLSALIVLFLAIGVWLASNRRSTREREGAA